MSASLNGLDIVVKTLNNIVLTVLCVNISFS